MKVLKQCGIAALKNNHIIGLIWRNITFKDKMLPYKAIVSALFRISHTNMDDKGKLERIQRRATKPIPELRDPTHDRVWYDNTILHTRTLRGDQI